MGLISITTWLTFGFLRASSCSTYALYREEMSTQRVDSSLTALSGSSVFTGRYTMCVVSHKAFGHPWYSGFGIDSRDLGWGTSLI